MRAMHLHQTVGRQIRQVCKMIGKESALDPVHAQVKAVGARTQRDGVGACLLLASGISRYGRDELAGRKWEAFELVDHELKVIALGGFRDADFSIESGRVQLSFQGKFHQARSCAPDEALGSISRRATGMEHQGLKSVRSSYGSIKAGESLRVLPTALPTFHADISPAG